MSRKDGKYLPYRTEHCVLHICRDTHKILAVTMIASNYIKHGTYVVIWYLDLIMMTLHLLMLPSQNASSIHNVH